MNSNIPDIDPDLLTPVEECQAPHTIDPNACLPCVIRGAAAQWPATRRWTFDHLAQLGGDRPVTLVVGNRELGETRFVASTFDACMGSLAAKGSIWGDGARTAHLKEFDLLREFPVLRNDVDMRALFPTHHHVASSAWVGPQGAHTGLHYDLLDPKARCLPNMTAGRGWPASESRSLQHDICPQRRCLWLTSSPGTPSMFPRAGGMKSSTWTAAFS
jgi:hypothetical protein